MKSYVDWFEAIGVGVLPIPYDTIDHEHYFYRINGLLLPGTDKGYDVKNPMVMQSAQRFFELSLQKGEYFPIFGICFGFQLLVSLVGGITRFATHHSDGLTALTILHEHAKLLSPFSKKDLLHLEHTTATLQNHQHGISVKGFTKNTSLVQFYHIVASAIDDKGKEYVAAIESKYFPVYGVQFHPERSPSWTPLLQFMVSELRRSSHRCTKLPLVGSVTNAHKCMHYDGLKHALCYFF